MQIPGADGERKSRGGILIPATAQLSKRLVWAEVVAVGPHVRGVERLNDAYFDHRMGFSHPADFVPVEQVSAIVQRELATVISVTRNFAASVSVTIERC